MKWFFFIAPRNILLAGRNFLLFGWHYFSIGYFVPRLFAPWHRDVSGYGRGFDLKRFLHIFGWNLISRVIGAILRIFVIALGVVFESAVIGATVLCFFAWYLLPVISAALIILGSGRLGK